MRGLISGVVLCEYPPQNPSAKQFRLFYSHQLQRLILLLGCCLEFKKKKKHPKHFQNKRIKEIIDEQGHHFTSYLSERLCSGVERKEDFLAHVSVTRYLLLEST